MSASFVFINCFVLLSIFACVLSRTADKYKYSCRKGARERVRNMFLDTISQNLLLRVFSEQFKTITLMEKKKIYKILENSLDNIIAKQF